MKRLLLPVALSLLLLAACRETPRTTEAASPGAAVPVQAFTAALEAWPAGYEATGTVRARTSTIISSKVMGYVREVKVQAGDRVREGQALVVLDSRDLDAGLRQAEAARDEARSAIPEVENAVAAAKANLELAQVTFGRMQDLFNKKSVSNQEYDEANAKLKAAKAGYEMALARRAQLSSKIAQAEQGREAAAIMRGYTRIAAPFSGVVTAKSVDPGVLATPGAPLVTIEREGAYRLEVPVEESRLASIRTGQAVSVVLDALNQTVPARVSEIVPAVDAASRSYVIKIDLPAVAQLRSGVYGRAQFGLGTRQVLAVPASAVVEHGQLQSVMVAAEGVARTRLVTTGQKSGGRVEVLSGLNAGEKVLVSPGVADGARVEVQP